MRNLNEPTKFEKRFISFATWFLASAVIALFIVVAYKLSNSNREVKPQRLYTVTCIHAGDKLVFKGLTEDEFSISKHGTIIRYNGKLFREYSPGVPCSAE